MTRRERLERKLVKRTEWAEKADAKAANLLADGMNYFRQMDGQPVIVGHHSEKRHRRAIARADRKLDKAGELYDLAKHHSAKADGIERQLEKSIFSDDADAIAQLKRKVDTLTRERDEMKRLNAWWRKHGTMQGCPGISDDAAARLDTDIPTRYSWERQPWPKWKLANLGAEIRRAEQRIAEITVRTERTANAAQSGGVLIEESGGYVRVTFAEKPARFVLDALRSAGFRWGGGSWVGPRAQLPAIVQSGTAPHGSNDTTTKEEGI